MSTGVSIATADRDPFLLDAVIQSLCGDRFPGAAIGASQIPRDASPHVQLELKFPGAEPLPAPGAGCVSRETKTSPLGDSVLAQTQLLELVPEGIIFTDIEGRAQCANPQAVTLLNCGDGSKLLEKSIFELINPKDRMRLQTAAAAVLQTGRLHHGEYLLTDASGHPHPVELSVAVLRTAHQEIRGLLVLLRDIFEKKLTEERVLELQTVLNEAQEAVLIRDLGGRIHYVNRSAEHLFGYTRQELKNRSLRELIFDGACDFDAVEKELHERGRWQGELNARTKSGQMFSLDVRMIRTRRSDGEPDYVVMIGSDDSDRKRTEQSLKEREQLSRRIIETALHGFWMVDLSGILLDVNEAYCQMCGFTKKELLNKHISELEVRETSRKAVAAHIERIIQKGGDHFETQHWRKDGSILDLEVSASYLNLGHPYLFAFLNDVTERKRLEGQERNFSRQILEAQDAERSRMGRELHDGVNQIIASAKMKLRKLDERSGVLGPAMREIISRCDKMLLRALNENRRIVHNLHPAELAELGLAEACRALCKEAESRTSMIVKSQLPRQWRRLSPAVELNLFRIAQETLRNAEQHAGAKSVQLKLGIDRHCVVMKIADDGRGFDTKTKKKSRLPNRGAGLANIRERTAIMGGTCSILSAPGQGTTITIRVPLDNHLRETAN